jgi:hypothetical protein
MPIIVLTASGGPKEWTQLAALDADGFIVKPVKADNVVAAQAPGGRARVRGAGAQALADGQHPAPERDHSVSHPASPLRGRQALTDRVLGQLRDGPQV